MPTDRKKLHPVIRIMLPLVFWLLVWQAAAMAVNKSLLIPFPGEVVKRLLELACTAVFWKSAGMSLLRIIAGSAAGICIGCILAVVTKCSRIADAVISPVVRIVRATPVASFIILILLWIKTGKVPIAVSCLVVIPMIWESVRTGIDSADVRLLEMARMYSFNTFTTWRYIYFPSIRPQLLSGTSNSIGLAWKSGIAAEVLCLPKLAVGTWIYNSKLYLETPSLFAWTIMVVLMSVIFENGVRKILTSDGSRQNSKKQAEKQ